ncbi:Cell cycle checkpoint protein RAD1 [Galdieria sulphuraria]|nr:Cell cycle checkpoint protein RAD1 [Galdieria sulphuraria]
MSTSRANVLRVVQVMENEPIYLILHDPDFVTQCRLKTIQAEPPVDFSFFASSVVCSAILASDLLREALQEIDVAGTEALKVSVKREGPMPTITLQGVGRDGTTDTYGGFIGISVCIEFPSPTESSSDVFAEFHVSDEFGGVVFPMHFIRRCVRALAFSDTCRLRVNQTGVLSLVIRFRTGSKTPEQWIEVASSYCFLEYLIRSLEG